MSSGNAGKKKREAPDAGPLIKNKSARCEDPAPTLNIQILNLALEWLDPKDLARSTQVCKGWHHGISQNSWKQAAENVNYDALKALHSAMQKIKGNKFDSQAMAAGLTKYIQLAPPTIPDPTLKPEDLFVLVEVEAFNVKRSWCKNLGEAIEAANFDGRHFLEVDYEDVLNEASPCEFQIPVDQRASVDRPQDGFNPYDTYAGLVFECMHLTLSFWRADTEQVFCFCHRQTYNDHFFDTYFNAENHELGCSVKSYFKADFEEPRGDVAKYICRQNNYNYFCPYVNVFLNPVLPKAGSREEPGWLKESRDTGEWDMDNSGELWNFLSKGDKSYWVSGLEVAMRFSIEDDESANDSVRSKRDFLLLLEDLKWK